MKKTFSILTILLFMCGCFTHITDLSMISNKNINLNKVDTDRLPTKTC